MAEGEAIKSLSDTQPKHFVLVHGAGDGAWCWFKVRRLLEGAGNKVTCLDLTGAGISLTDSSSILTFDDYNKPFFDFMSALPEGHKVILVGHSAGGLSLCHSLQNFGEKIEVAIFIAGTMLPSGFCTEEDLKAGAPDLPEDKPPTTVSFSEDDQRKLLYQLSQTEVEDLLLVSAQKDKAFVHGFSQQDAVLASMLVRPSPIQALRSAKFEGKINDVKRIYIKTTYDKIIKPEQQDAMIRMWPPHQVFHIDTDHSPYFSAPQELFQLIVRASACTI